MAAAISLGVNHFGTADWRWSATGLPKPHRAAQKRPGNVISIEEARALFLTNGAVFIDARPAEAYRSGHIQGALNLPPDNFEESLPDIMEQVPPDSLIITYCDGENCT